jgi:hypothetical protein
MTAVPLKSATILIADLQHQNMSQVCPIKSIVRQTLIQNYKPTQGQIPSLSQTLPQLQESLYSSLVRQLQLQKHLNLTSSTKTRKCKVPKQQKEQMIGAFPQQLLLLQFTVSEAPREKLSLESTTLAILILKNLHRNRFTGNLAPNKTTLIAITIDHLLIEIRDTLPITNTPTVVKSIPLLERNTISLAVTIAQSLPPLRKNTLIEPRSQKTNALQRIGIANITILKNHPQRGVIHNIPRVCTQAAHPNGTHLTIPVRNPAHEDRH